VNATFPPQLAGHLAESVRSARRRYRKRLARCQEKFSEKAVHGLRIETRRILADIVRENQARGVTDPNAPAAAPVVQYTWGKLWNSKASNACSTMPRFGHAGVLTQAQIRDLMALLLDPRSPVNAQ